MEKKKKKKKAGDKGYSLAKTPLKAAQAPLAMANRIHCVGVRISASASEGVLMARDEDGDGDEEEGEGDLSVGWVVV